jgi:hypothetical protein
MSRMSDLMLDIQCDLEEGILSYAEIAAKHDVPVTWVIEAVENMLVDAIPSPSLDLVLLKYLTDECIIKPWNKRHE